MASLHLSPLLRPAGLLWTVVVAAGLWVWNRMQAPPRPTYLPRPVGRAGRGVEGRQSRITQRFIHGGGGGGRRLGRRQADQTAKGTRRRCLIWTGHFPDERFVPNSAGAGRQCRFSQLRRPPPSSCVHRRFSLFLLFVFCVSGCLFGVLLVSVGSLLAFG